MNAAQSSLQIDLYLRLTSISATEADLALCSFSFSSFAFLFSCRSLLSFALF